MRVLLVAILCAFKIFTLLMIQCQMFKVKAIKLSNHQTNLSIQNEESAKASTIQHLHDAIRLMIQFAISIHIILNLHKQ